MKIKLLNERAIVPTRGSEYAAGYDLYCASASNIIVYAGGCEKVPTGLVIEIPHGYFGAIFPRSGLATQQGLRLANCVAVIDEDYRGEWIVPIFNDDSEGHVIHPGERIAQVVFIPYLADSFDIVDEITETKRGSGGFGSTGI